MEKIDRPSYWLDKAANALDCAIQLCGTKDESKEINELEKRCDFLASKLKEEGR